MSRLGRLTRAPGVTPAPEPGRAELAQREGTPRVGGGPARIVGGQRRVTGGGLMLSPCNTGCRVRRGAVRPLCCQALVRRTNVPALEQRTIASDNQTKLNPNDPGYDPGFLPHSSAGPPHQGSLHTTQPACGTLVALCPAPSVLYSSPATALPKGHLAARDSIRQPSRLAAPAPQRKCCAGLAVTPLSCPVHAQPPS